MFEPIWNLPQVELRELSTLKETRTTALLTGNRAWAAVGPLLSLPVAVQAEPTSIEIAYLDAMAASLPEQIEVIYGVGGGRVADATKYIAWKSKLPAVLIPTALSVDGYFTALVAAREDGTVRYHTTGPAEKVIVDMDVISTAPAHIRGTGIVEILSMTTGLLDWKYAAERKQNTPLERFQPWAASIAAGIAQQAYKIAADVGAGKVDALRNLLDLICVEVQLTNQLGHNRPQEGSEQYFAYAVERKLAQNNGIPYADLVGPGILVAAALHKQNVAPIRDTLLSAGVRLDRLRREDIISTLHMFPQYAIEHGLPFSILHENTLSDAEAQKLINDTGLGQ